MQQTRRLGQKPERSPRKPTNVSLPEDLVGEAKALNVNVSQACEQGLEQAVSRSKADRWLEDNREALEQWNAWVEKNGLPLARYRQF